MVLGAAVHPDGGPSPTLARRARHGAALWRPGDLLVLTGGVGRHPPSEAEVAATLARGLGVPDAAIREERRSTTTVGNLSETRALPGLPPRARFLIVTDRWHLPRALLAARLMGLRAEGSAAPAIPGEVPRLRLLRSLLREAAALLPTALRAWRARRPRAQT